MENIVFQQENTDFYVENMVFQMTEYGFVMDWILHNINNVDWIRLPTYN